MSEPKFWQPVGTNSGMRHMEESECLGGATDCDESYECFCWKPADNDKGFCLNCGKLIRYGTRA